MKTFALHILSPDRTFYDGECESLVLPIVDGKYGIMADHSNTIAAVVPGELSYRTPDGRTHYAAVLRDAHIPCAGDDEVEGYRSQRTIKTISAHKKRAAMQLFFLCGGGDGA